MSSEENSQNLTKHVTIEISRSTRRNKKMCQHNETPTRPRRPSYFRHSNPTTSSIHPYMSVTLAQHPAAALVPTAVLPALRICERKHSEIKQELVFFIAAHVSARIFEPIIPSKSSFSVCSSRQQIERGSAPPAFLLSGCLRREHVDTTTSTTSIHTLFQPRISLFCTILALTLQETCSVYSQTVNHRVHSLC